MVGVIGSCMNNCVIVVGLAGNSSCLWVFPLGTEFVIHRGLGNWLLINYYYLFYIFPFCHVITGKYFHFWVKCLSLALCSYRQSTWITSLEKDQSNEEDRLWSILLYSVFRKSSHPLTFNTFCCITAWIGFTGLHTIPHNVKEELCLLTFFYKWKAEMSWVNKC